MNNRKKIIIGALIAILFIFIFSFYGIVKKKQPSGIENITIYEKNKVLALLSEQYPDEEFEIVCYFNEIMKDVSKWSPFEKQIGKIIIVRPIGEFGKEFLVYYYFNKDSKFKVEFKNYYEEYSEKLDILEEYLQPIIEKTLEDKEKWIDYNVGFEILEDGRVDIAFYVNDEEFKKSEIPVYYNYFEIIADRLAEKFENQGMEKYRINIKLYRTVHTEFNNVIKHLSRNALNIIENDVNFYKFYWYTLSKDEGEITKKSYEEFLEGYRNEAQGLDEKNESDIENLTIYQKKALTGKLEDKFGEEVEVIHYLGKSSFDKDVFFVKVNYDDEDKFLVRYEKNYPWNVPYVNKLAMIDGGEGLEVLTEYMESMIDAEDNDYIIAFNLGNDKTTMWLDTIENIDDYFYTEPFHNDDWRATDGKLDEEGYIPLEFDYENRNINIVLYLRYKENLDLYYNCFYNIADKFMEKIESEESDVEKLEMEITVYRLDEETFNYMKEFSSGELSCILVYVNEINGIYEGSYSFKITK